MDFDKIRQCIKTAESATRILRKLSWWSETGAEKRFPNRDRFAARLKALRLVAILAEFDLPEEKVNNLVERTIAAVDDLAGTDGSTKARIAIKKKIGKASACAEAFATAWSCLDHDLKDTLQSHMEGTLGLTFPAFGANQILENCDRSERMFAVFDNDLRYLVAELKTLHDALDADSSRNPFEYNCIYRIASAWHENIGRDPTYSNNASAVSGPSATGFQKYVGEAVSPRHIGPAIVRQAVDAFRFGAVKTAKP